MYLIIMFVGSGSPLGYIQWRVIASTRGTQTQEAFTAVPHLPAVHLPVLSLQWCMNVYSCHRRFHFITNPISEQNPLLQPALPKLKLVIFAIKKYLFWLSNHVLFLLGSGIFWSVPCLLIPGIAWCPPPLPSLASITGLLSAFSPPG